MAVASGSTRLPSLPSVFASVPNSKELLELVDQWADLFGYHAGRIVLKQGNLSTMCLPSCSLTAHAPLWGTKPGQEKAVPVAEVRKTLSSVLAFVKIARHGMQLSMRKSGKELCLFFKAHARLRIMPCFSIVTESLVFVVKFENDEQGALKIASVDEWPVPSATVGEARKVLAETCFWPQEETVFAPYIAFGALS